MDYEKEVARLREIITNYIVAKRNDAGLNRRERDEAIHTAYTALRNEADV